LLCTVTYTIPEPAETGKNAAGNPKWGTVVRESLVGAHWEMARG
jgi:hypothetical protein